MNKSLSALLVASAIGCSEKQPVMPVPQPQPTVEVASPDVEAVATQTSDAVSAVQEKSIEGIYNEYIGDNLRDATVLIDLLNVEALHAAYEAQGQNDGGVDLKYSETRGISGRNGAVEISHFVANDDPISSFEAIVTLDGGEYKFVYTISINDNPNGTSQNLRTSVLVKEDNRSADATHCEYGYRAGTTQAVDLVTGETYYLQEGDFENCDYADPREQPFLKQAVETLRNAMPDSA